MGDFIGSCKAAICTEGETISLEEMMKHPDLDKWDDWMNTGADRSKMPPELWKYQAYWTLRQAGKLS